MTSQITRNDLGEFDWWEQNVTSEIYVNTHRADWWKACDVLSDEMCGASRIIDVGGGDAHTLWQVLSMALKKGAMIDEVEFIEPNANAIRRAQTRLSQLPIKKVYTHQETLEEYGSRMTASNARSYDVLYAGHVNYYFGRVHGGHYDLTAHNRALELLPHIGNTVIIMTAPRSSDYYRVVAYNPFCEHVYSDAVANFYRSRGYGVRRIKTPIRFYVAHAFKSDHEATVLWKFFHDTNREPNEQDVSDFLCRLLKVKDDHGYINFKDELVIVSHKLPQRRPFRRGSHNSDL